MGTESDARFTALWHAHAGRVLAYARRHVGAEEAEEVAAETFVVAWRRLPDVPPDALPWLLVVARNVISTRRRSLRRRRALVAEVQRAVEVHASRPSAEAVVLERVELARALWRLRPVEREALFLVAWDGLSLQDGARVADCSLSAFTTRVHRARTRLRREIDSAPGPPHTDDRRSHPDTSPSRPSDDRTEPVEVAQDNG